MATLRVAGTVSCCARPAVVILGCAPLCSESAHFRQHERKVLASVGDLIEFGLGETVVPRNPGLDYRTATGYLWATVDEPAWGFCVPGSCSSP
jgi:hypothetical protein